MEELAQVIRSHKKIALDTNCFIYYLEAAPAATILREDVFSPLEQGRFQAVTSTLTLAEVLVKPKSLGREDICMEYVMLLSSYPNLAIIPFTLPIAVRCAEIRAEYRVRTPDAIQLATAIESQATLFLTNDLNLPRQISQLTILFLKDYLQS